MIEYLSNPVFWIGLGQIIIVNIVLSGDNAVVIALAARSLPPKQQKQAVIWGSAAAVVMRIILTIVAVELLRLAFLKLIGAALLLWIGVQLLLPEKEEGHGGASVQGGMFIAIRTILIADLVMSLDNVIGVAAAAKGSITLLVLGLLISIPLVIFGSTILMRFMVRSPFPTSYLLLLLIIPYTCGSAVQQYTYLILAQIVKSKFCVAISARTPTYCTVYCPCVA